MSADVLAFGMDCNKAIAEALQESGITYRYTDFGDGPTEGLEQAASEINMGDVRLVLCTVRPPAPLGVLDLLTKVKDALADCAFYFYAATKEELNAKIPDRGKATALGAIDFLVPESPRELQNKIKQGLQRSKPTPSSAVALTAKVTTAGTFKPKAGKPQTGKPKANKRKSAR